MSETSGPLNPTAKYSRMWNMPLIEKLCDLTEALCQSQQKLVDSLTEEDFSSIAEAIERSPLDCLIKIRSVMISGSLKPGIWSNAEDKLLESLLADNLSWKDISFRINSIIHGGLTVRTPKNCSERWNNHLNPLIKHGNWTEEEDRALFRSYLQWPNLWDSIANDLGNRTGTAVKNRFNSLVRKERKINRKERKEVVVDALVKRYTSRC